MEKSADMADAEGPGVHIIWKRSTVGFGDLSDVLGFEEGVKGCVVCA